MFLTAAELEALTGYRLPAWQAKWLDARGWRYERARSGAVLVSRSHAEAMMGGSAPRAPEPNFETIGG